MSNNNSVKLAVKLVNGMVIKCGEKYMVVLVHAFRTELMELSYSHDVGNLTAYSSISDKQSQEDLFPFSNMTKLNGCFYRGQPLFVKELEFVSELLDNSVVTLDSTKYIIMWGEEKWRLYMISNVNHKINFVNSDLDQEQLFRNNFGAKSLKKLRQGNVNLFN